MGESLTEREAAPCVVCLGFFDGVHLAHQALLQAAKREGNRLGLPVCVHTFDHAPGAKEFELTTLKEREALLKKYGADTVSVSAFTEEMRHMPGDVFFREIVLNRLNARHVVCGDDHRFGYKGAWGVSELQALCDEAGIGLTVVPQVALPDGQRVSSTAIRRAIREGNTALAEKMLGRTMKKSTEHRAQSTENIV
ncbi:MAG: adenylyltransferase/cytidyltransferase family protein [Clostridia bacterium]|nr:adenylyltransferase/cytidyltransferase family protein [Clostridia bacterium]MBR0408063.1 adenylyltransferase/cytidyltransferase family protein [Clostridia bacterium]